MKKHKKYFLRIVGFILLVLFVLVIVLGVFVFFRAENYINKNLSGWVDRESKHLYELSFDNISIRYDPFSIVVSDISLTANKAEAAKILAKSPDKVLYDFKSPEMEIRRINILKFVKNKSFRCKSVTILKPELKLSGTGIIQLDTTQTFENLFVEMQPLFKKQVKNIRIDEINFVDANYKIYSSAAHFKTISNAQQISVTIKKFHTDSTLIFNASRFFDSEDILIKMNNFSNQLGDSLHVVTIDTLGYSLKTSDIFASGFHLSPIRFDSEKNLYDVHVPRMHVKSKSITRLSISDSIGVQSLTFEHPQIKFYQKENPEKFDIENINQFNLYSLVENQFININIDTFLLNNANLEIFRQPDKEQYQQQFESINIELYGFELDSASSKNKDKIFHADDLTMMVHGYHLRLEDNQHEFMADSMYVSTLSNSLGTKNIIISPLATGNINSHTEVNIQCRELGIENVNLKTLFHTRTLPTKNIRINEPNVKIQYHSEIKRKNDRMEAGLLFKLVSAYLKGVYSEVVWVEKGKLNIEKLNQNVEQGYFETNFNFTLSGFSLDEQSMKQTDKFFYASNFDLQFTDYQMKLVDNLHKINVDRISILSSERKLEINNLLLEPVISDPDTSKMQQFNRSELYRIFVPKIDLYGINLRDAFFYNTLTMSQFKITDPEIYFENFGALRQKQEKTEIAEVYDLLFNYLSDINISEISVPNGKFIWVNHTKKGKTTSFDNAFSATLENFRLNENELKKQRLLFSDNFNITLKDQVFQLSDSVHILQAGKINLSTANSSVFIIDAFLYPDLKSKNYGRMSTTFQVSIPTLQISNINFLKAWYSKELFLGKVELNRSKFRVFSKKGAVKSLDLNKFQFPLPSFITFLQLNELKINKAQVITYETNGPKQLVRSNFEINLSLPKVSVTNNEQNKIKITTQNLIAGISNFSTKLGNGHDLKIDELNFNRQQKNVAVSQLQIVPNSLSKGKNEFVVFAPKLNFSGFDVNQALEKNHFIFNEISIANSKIAIDIADSIKGDKLEFTKNLDLYPFIEPYVDKVEVNRLLLTNVDIDFNWFEKVLINRRFNMDFKEINIAENQKTENLLHAREFEISTTNLRTKSKNELYEFSAESLVYNSEKHNTLLNNIKITPLLTREQFNKRNRFQTDYVNGNIQFIELKGVNESLWLQQNILDAGALVIGKTNLDIFRNKRIQFNENQRPPWPQDLIKEIGQPFVFDSVILKPSTVKYSELLDLSDEPGYLTFNDLKLKTGKISNISKTVSQNPVLKINASANLMNLSLLSAKFEFDMLATDYAHTLEGKLNPVSLTTFNTMIEKSVPVSIESGQLNRMDFNISFNNKIALGELYLGYDDFKISVLNFDNSETKKSKLATFWANNMVLNSKNPKGNELLPETISYERDPQRSIINFWWKAIFTGSKQTIGLKTDK